MTSIRQHFSQHRERNVSCSSQGSICPSLTITILLIKEQLRTIKDNLFIINKGKSSTEADVAALMLRVHDQAHYIILHSFQFCQIHPLHNLQNLSYSVAAEVQQTPTLYKLMHLVHCGKQKKRHRNVHKLEEKKCFGNKICKWIRAVTSCHLWPLNYVDQYYTELH